MCKLHILYFSCYQEEIVLFAAYLLTVLWTLNMALKIMKCIINVINLIELIAL